MKSSYKNSLFKNFEPPDDILDYIFVGRGSDYDIAEGPFSDWYKTAHVDKMTDFNLWKRPLSIDEMIAWTNCRYIND